MPIFSYFRFRFPCASRGLDFPRWLMGLFRYLDFLRPLMIETNASSCILSGMTMTQAAELADAPGYDIAPRNWMPLAIRLFFRYGECMPYACAPRPSVQYTPW